MTSQHAGCAPSQHQRVRGGVGHDDDRRRSRRRFQHPPRNPTPWSLPGTRRLIGSRIIESVVYSYHILLVPHYI